MQARERTAQHGEARARELGRDIAVQPAVACAQLDMVLDLEIEAARRAPAVLLEVVALVLACGHGRIRQVGNAERDRFQRAADAFQFDFRGLQLLAEAGDFRHHRGDILAPGLELADLLAAGVAQVLQLLGAHLDALAVGLQRFQLRHVEVEAAAFAQALREIGGLVAEQRGIEHCGQHP